MNETEEPVALEPTEADEPADVAEVVEVDTVVVVADDDAEADPIERDTIERDTIERDTIERDTIESDAARVREARGAIEAVLMVATEPVEPAVLAQLVELPTAQVEELCAVLAAEYRDEARGFVLARVAGGYRYQTHEEYAPYVERFVLDGQHARLSPAALETLAIVAYKQPISRAQVSAIRGVNVDATMRTLIQRGYIEEVGTEPTPGNPSLFGTTRTFLERLGVDALGELPPLGDFVPDAHVVEALERGLRVTPEVPSTDAGATEAASPVEEPVAEAPAAEEPAAVEPVESSGGADLAIAADLASGVPDHD